MGSKWIYGQGEICPQLGCYHGPVTLFIGQFVYPVEEEGMV